MPDLGGPPLIIEAADRRIIVQRGAPDPIEEVDVARPQIDAAHHLPADDRRGAGIAPGCSNNSTADRRNAPATRPTVSRGIRRPEDRQDEIGSARGRPQTPKRLPEIGLMERNALPGSDVDDCRLCRAWCSAGSARRCRRPAFPDLAGASLNRMTGERRFVRKLCTALRTISGV